MKPLVLVWCAVVAVAVLALTLGCRAIGAGERPSCAPAPAEPPPAAPLAAQPPDRATPETLAREARERWIRSMPDLVFFEMPLSCALPLPNIERWRETD